MVAHVSAPTRRFVRRGSSQGKVVVEGMNSGSLASATGDGAFLADPGGSLTLNLVSG